MTPKNICVDANFVVLLVKADSETSPFMVLWEQWKTAGNQIIAPTILAYEITNVFHRMAVAGQILPEEAEELLTDAFNLDIRLYGDKVLHQRALILARNFSLAAAYDAHYLALAEQFSAEFYTSDQRLFNKVKDTLTWVHLVT